MKKKMAVVELEDFLCGVETLPFCRGGAFGVVGKLSILVAKVKPPRSLALPGVARG